jgi:hypothetical protein
MIDDGTPSNRHSNDGQVVNVGSIKTRRGGNDELDSGEYAILVSCHCSHTGNTLFLILDFYEENLLELFSKVTNMPPLMGPRHVVEMLMWSGKVIITSLDFSC